MAANALVFFPGMDESSHAQSRKHVGGKKEVYPLKKQEHREAMQRYFLENKDYVSFLYFVLGINMGFRGGDLAEMPWNVLLNDDGSIRHEQEEVGRKQEQKTGKFRDVILNPACVEAIEWYLKRTGIKPNLWCEECKQFYVFPSKLSKMNGKPVYHVTDDTMGRVLQKARKAVGIPFSVATHSLRKTYGYQQYKQGKDITLLMREFNHSSPAITLNYIGITSDIIYDAHQTMENNLVDLSQY